ncbi:uncharacterized isoform X1 [Zea mays]|uniref:RING-type E3 ubiquitin transferase n=1 Tax=Zea mays TaxID=4577 RepID=C0PN50_MAIZE|nr:uncharacterized protein LOC100191204 isoform X1 [Zea mays]ACN36616.1 unknown [Zea mays]|eukprot:XP_008667000.1 uncharacterized protein LOC100191204 isoform X1 [Zea mays]
MASRDAGASPRSAPHRPGAVAPKDGADLLSPRFRSAAALAGWDEESVLLAAMVVEDTPVRESRRKRRASTSSAGGSAGSSTRKMRPRRQSPAKIPPVVLALDDDDDDDAAVNAATKEEEKVVVVGDKEASGSGDKAASGSGDKAVATGNLPCMDRLREELSCAICLEICFEPTTTSCGHSFCMKCLIHAASKCGKRCPKCRQFISNSRSCTINTVLWNTIQLLFPGEVEARKNSTSPCDKDASRSPLRANRLSQGGNGMRTRTRSRSSSTEARTRSSYRSFMEPGSTTSTNTGANFISAQVNTRSRRGFVQASQLLLPRRSAVRLDQSEDAALAYRLQQEEFMNAFEEPEQERQQPRNAVSTARDTLRAIASRAVRLRARGWHV